MDFTEVIFGQSLLQNPLKAYCSSNFYNDKYLYVVAGIHGSSMEGINILNQLLLWFKDSASIIFPCVLIPIIDVDGYLYPSISFKSKRNLNNLFPNVSIRHGRNPTKGDIVNKLQPEIESLNKILLHYPPQLFLNLRTASKSAKIIAVGEEGVSVASFLSKATNYPIISDNAPTPNTLESFIYECFLCPVVTVRLPFFTEKKTLSDIYEENKNGLQQLFTGQVY